MNREESSGSEATVKVSWKTSKRSSMSQHGGKNKWAWFGRGRGFRAGVAALRISQVRNLNKSSSKTTRFLFLLI